MDKAKPVVKPEPVKPVVVQPKPVEVKPIVVQPEPVKVIEKKWWETNGEYIGLALFGLCVVVFFVCKIIGKRKE